MTKPKTATREQWREARIELLRSEKELTRRSDELARQRRALPWVEAEKDYAFETEKGTERLADLFEGRSQLLVFHLMYAPEWEGACSGCSFTADHLDGAVAHLEAAGVTFVAISRAPLAKLDAYKRRMGWGFRWVSSEHSDFNYDFGVSFSGEQQENGAEHNYRWADELAEVVPDLSDATGISTFVLDGGVVYHTYSAYDRGTDVLSTTWQLLDRVPFGRRDEVGWLRRHDEYAEPEAKS